MGHPGALGMELLGVRDILVFANQLAEERGEPAPYRVEIATHDGAPLELMAGLRLEPVRNLAKLRTAPDTLIVIGGRVAHEAATIPALVSEVRRVARRSRRVVGVCTGAFILAAAGLLDDRKATTHWMFGDLLAAQNPAVKVDTDPIYMCDRGVWTSAGITSGFDMLLAIVEEDVGADLARAVAQILVLYLRRTGNQAQFSVQLGAQFADRRPLRELQNYIAENPAADLSLTALADRMHLSPRHFARVFTTEVGVPPGRYVEKVRLEAARRMLEEATRPVEVVATAAGFGNAQALRRAFLVAFGVSPAEYRRRFAPPGLTLVG
ncbi:MAG TPA: helix-turn-helix domain-containing protein [Sporichthyaceae bacterium]|nr:helix-turn-helix domain-containing protein [Sporichthyaceae bacterium]